MNKRHEKTGDLLAVLVFALFALCLLLVLLGGAGVYSRIAAAGDARYANYTPARYIATRVRQGHAVALEDFGGVEALTFRQELDGEAYLTRVYCYEGQLWELYTPAAGDFAPEDGEPVMELEALAMELTDGVLTVDTGAQTLVLTLREERQVQP